MTTFAEAIESALALAMAEDERIVIFGEDVQMLRRNLLVRFGAARVRNTPISESAFLGAAAGAAMAGLRPVVEIMLVDFVGVALDALLNHAAKLRAFSGGRWNAPLVVRAACGGGYGDGGQHEQALWGMLAGIPGLSVVVPSNPADAAGLMLSAIADDGPVVFLEHKLLSDYWLDYLGSGNRSSVSFDVPQAGARGTVPTPIARVPIGVAATLRAGSDLALISLGVGTHRCLDAAVTLADRGLQCAVMDLRSVAPLDRAAILDLAEATGRVLVVDEDYISGGLSGEIAATLAEHGSRARFARVATMDALPYARALEDQALPHVQKIIAAAEILMRAENEPHSPPLRREGNRPTTGQQFRRARPDHATPGPGVSASSE
jgi:pyruvate dehydrogenase E1 component beta subunit